MNIISQTIYTVPEVSPYPAQISLSGKDRNNQKKKYVLSERSVAFVGCPGCGKTTQLFKIVDALDTNPDAVTIILDIKKEYVKRCFKPGDIVLSLYDIDGIPKQNQARWSLMHEAWFDTHPETILKEIAGMMFKDAIQHSQNKAFPIAAMLVFYGQLIYFFKSSNGILPSTGELIRKIETVSDSEILSSVKKYTELFAVGDFLSEKTNLTGFGIRMELKSVLLNTFQLDTNFCNNTSRFSIREFILSSIATIRYI